MVMAYYKGMNKHSQIFSAWKKCVYIVAITISNAVWCTKNSCGHSRLYECVWIPFLYVIVFRKSISKLFYSNLCPRLLVFFKNRVIEVTAWRNPAAERIELCLKNSKIYCLIVAINISCNHWTPIPCRQNPPSLAQTKIQSEKRTKPCRSIAK